MVDYGRIWAEANVAPSSAVGARNAVCVL